MIELFHKYNRSIVLTFVALVISLSMLSFGVDFGGTGRRVDGYAIRVDDDEVTYREFNQRRREIEDFYRARFGKNFHQFLEMTGTNINQQIVDDLVPAILLRRLAGEFDMGVSDAEVRESILQSFGGNFNPAVYSAYLQQIGMQPREYEERLRNNALPGQIEAFVTDLARASETEAKLLLERQERPYTVEYVELDPKKFEAQVAEPGKEELEEYYGEHASEYEEPDRVKYRYTVFKPEAFESAVEVNEDDIALYHEEHQNDFAIPEKVKVQHIELLYPQGSTDEERKKIEELAQEVHAKAEGGEDFAALAEQYSDDVETKFTGGDIGWLARGSRSPRYEALAFGLKAEGVTELLQEERGFYIIKVSEYVPREIKPVEEVKAEIESKIRKRESAAYASEAALARFDEWQKSGKKLEEFSNEITMASDQTPELLDKARDPTAELRGLTAAVLQFPTETQQQHDLDNVSVLVELEEFKAAEIPSLETAREKVLAAYKAEKAREAAREAAEKLVAELTDGKSESLRKAAEAAKYEVATKADLKAAAPGGNPFSNPEVQREIFSTPKAGAAPQEMHEVGGKFYVFQVTEIKDIDWSTMQEKLKEYRDRETRNNGTLVMTALINELKAGADIEIAGAVLGE